MVAPSRVPVLENEGQTALLISPAGEDHETFGELFHRQGWRLEHANSLRSASVLLNKKAASVVITERDLPIGDWKDVLEAMQSLPSPPLVIVISRLADEHLWAEALNLGVYDVLAKPLDHTEVVRALTLAWFHRQKAAAVLTLAGG